LLSSISAFLKLVLSGLRIWRSEEQEQDGKNELRVEQQEDQIQAAKEAQKIEQEVARASAGRLNDWLRPPSERG
jgi:ABC-type Na+ efflux pump permease subunit